MCRNARKVLVAALDAQYNYAVDKLNEFIESGDDQAHEGQAWIEQIRHIHAVVIQAHTEISLQVTPDNRGILIDAVDLYYDVIDNMCLDSLSEEDIERIGSSLLSQPERARLINEARRVAFDQIDRLVTLKWLRTLLSFQTNTVISLDN